MSDIPAEPTTSRRLPDPAVYRVGAALMAAALAVAALVRLPLTWDGAWFFVRAMDSGTPTFLYRRGIHVMLQAPAILSRSVVDDVALPAFLFSTAYALVPLVALLAAWRVVRADRPELILWPILGIAFVALPGQAFFISESSFVAALTWPLVLASALGRVHRHRLMVAAIVLAMALSHPYAGPAFGAAGIVGWIALARGARGDGPWVGSWLLGAGAALTAINLWLRTPYEIEASSLERLVEQFRGTVAEGAEVAPLVAWLIGATAFMRLPPRVRAVAVVALLGLTAVVLVPWALDPQAWAQSLRYRAWLVFLALPLFAMAMLDVWRRSPWTDWRLVAIGAPAVMAVVLISQGWSWLGLQTRLAASMAAAPPGCLATAEIGWIRSTPVAHWSVTSLGVALEGRDPTHLVLFDRPCEGAIDPARVVIKVTPFERDERPVDGWWGFRSLSADPAAP